MKTDIPPGHRILVIDDNPAIHHDFRKILGPAPETRAELGAAAASLFGRSTSQSTAPRFEIDSATRGQDGLQKVRAAVGEGRPYSMAYVDVRMPNGWDGIETISRIWQEFGDLLIVICTAFSDHSWEEIQARLGNSDRFLILKKPFDNLEVRQFTYALAQRAQSERELREAQHQRRAAEESFRQSEALRQAMLNNSPALIFSKDLEGRYLEVNAGFEKLCGRPRGEILGRTDAELFSPDQAGRFRENDLKVLAADAPIEFEETALYGDESHVSIVSKFPLRDAHGKTYATCGIATDITERKRLERDFLRVQRMDGIGTLAGGIAHDLNNVLAPIVMSIDLLKLKVHEPTCVQMLHTIETSARRGADMVRQVLSFARGAEGERHLMQPGYLLKDVQEIVADTFPKNIAIKTDIARDLWNVEGDATQLHQVMLNLCVNARDAMPGGGEIAITAENAVLDENYAAMNTEARPGSYVVIRVDDDGSGIPAPVLEKIFDPFFTTKEIGKGTGLGLSTSLGIVKGHGGFILVTSEVGKGTSFRVHLPADAGAAAPAADADAIAPRRGDGELILVIDDEEPIREVAQLTLEAHGYRVIVAADGAEAVKLFAKRKGEIALVITDMMMPVMDGPATIRVLRKIDPAVKIIAASGMSSEEQISELADAGGVQHFLPKPYTSDVMRRALATTLDNGNRTVRGLDPASRLALLLSA